jgi:crotonobetainyl-CoA:carnitine CoA-transferase CaiB-like acyl-CoA transferase
MSKVLEGIRVLDFGRFIAGPFCAALLADYGADVIRIDRIGGTDDRTLTPVTETGEGTLFLQVNRNKRSMTLDFERPEGREIFHQLLRDSDIVVANMPPRALAHMGLDYESLRKIKPDIILTASTAFGLHETARDRVGFDGVGQALSGAVHVSGFSDRPMKAMVPVVDFGTGLSCALGTMLALYERKHSGMGQEVHASLLHTGLNYASGTLIEEAVMQLDRKAAGNRAPTYAPSDIFETQDGWVIVQVIGASMFKRWTRLIGRIELLDDPRFQDDEARGRHGEILGAYMSEWCAGRTRAQALADLESARIPAGPVLSPKEVLQDEMIAASGAFHWMPFPGAARPIPIVAPPVALSRTPPDVHSRAPTLGEHTDEILKELGYLPSNIEAFKQLGFV